MHKALFFLFLFSFSCAVYGQVGESVVRPKIGLALSGGSAHGFAHIGVIRYLEELGIEVDYVTGTSMGSIIGGLHAMGFDSYDIEKVASELDWDMIMSNDIPLNEVAPIEKTFHGRIPLSVLWTNNSFRLPKGFIRGQKLDLVISKVYCPAHSVSDFDAFHKPFRCVAVNIEDGSVEVFDKGYLGNAIRASMSIPTIFPPKELNDKLYVDGGLIRNFPVEEVIDVGADFVIGVFVGSDMSKKDELNSMIDVLRQSASMAGMLDSKEQQKLADILVVPDMEEHGTFDFNDYVHCIEEGYEAAKEQKEVFIKLADKLNRYSDPQRNGKLTYPSSLRFKEITTIGCDPVFERMILSRLKLWENYAVDLDQIDESLSLIYGTKNFSKTAYSFYQTDEGLGLEIDVDEAPPFSLGFNVNRYNLYNTALVISGDARNVIGRPSYFRMDARISDFPGIQGQYFIRVPSAPSLLFRVSSKLEKFELPLYEGKNKGEVFDYEQGYLKIDLVKEWKNKYLFNIGYQFLHDEIRPESISMSFGEYQSERSEIFAGIEYNDLNTEPYAHSGNAIKFSINYMFNNTLKIDGLVDPENPLATYDLAYLGSDVQIENYTPLAGRICLKTSLRGRYDFGDSFLDSYRVGGTDQSKYHVHGHVGVDDSELILGNHVSARLALRLQLRPSIYLSPLAQYTIGERYYLNATESVSLWATGLAVDYDSPLGPISVDLGYASLTSRVVVNFGVGYRHIF